VSCVSGNLEREGRWKLDGSSAGGGLTAEWLADAIAASGPTSEETASVQQLREHLLRWAEGFAAIRPDVQSSSLTWPRRGLRDDECGSFLRAFDAGLLDVDDAGFVTMRQVRQKRPPGRYALLSKSGTGVSVNLEYLIQMGATAELALEHGWPPSQIDFERGEFDAFGLDSSGDVSLAMEAKARVTGPDSLEGLVATWIVALEAADQDRPTNAGRKLRQLRELCAQRPVVVWLVADGARWTLTAAREGAELTLSAVGSPTYAAG
jgi:hypothetical protein